MWESNQLSACSDVALKQRLWQHISMMFAIVSPSLEMLTLIGQGFGKKRPPEESVLCTSELPGIMSLGRPAFRRCIDSIVTSPRPSLEAVQLLVNQRIIKLTLGL